MAYTQEHPTALVCLACLMGIAGLRPLIPAGVGSAIYRMLRIHQEYYTCLKSSYCCGEAQSLDHGPTNSAKCTIPGWRIDTQRDQQNCSYAGLPNKDAFRAQGAINVVVQNDLNCML